MAFTTLIMKHPQTGQLKQAPIGFSWTSLFFGPWVALYRGNYWAFPIWFILNIFTCGIASPFFYNKFYLKYLINRGYMLKHSPISIDIVEAKTKIKLPLFPETIDGGTF